MSVSPNIPGVQLLDLAGLPYAVGAGGGGTQYGQGAAQASPTGTVAFAKTAANVVQALALDGSGNLNVNVAAGSSGNAASSATGAVPPAQAGYTGIKVGANLQGQTGVTPSGSIMAAQQDLASIAGTTADTNSGVKSAGTLRVVLATDQPALSTAMPVSAAALPLPTGAATGALQTTGNTSVASIDTKTPALGQALAAASVPVILPSATVTTLTPPAAIAGFALEAGHLATIDTSTARIPTVGQKAMAASLPIVIASDQGAVPANISQIGGSALALGQAVKASSIPVTMASDSPNIGVNSTVANFTTSLPAGTNGLGGSTLMGNTQVGAPIPATAYQDGLADAAQVAPALANGGALLSGGNVVTNNGQYDRLRSAQWFKMTLGLLTTATQGSASLVFTTAANTAQLLPGSPIALFTGTTWKETVYVAAAYTPGTATVPLTSNIQNTGVDTARFNVYDVMGPGNANGVGFLPFGMGMTGLAAFDVGQSPHAYFPISTASQDGRDTRNVLAVATYQLNGSSLDRSRMPEIMKSASATALGNTAVWTPTAGKKFRLLKYSIEVTANSSLAAGAVELISFQDASTGFGFTHSVFIPTTAGTTIAGSYNSGWIDLGGWGYISTAINQVLNVNLGTALATGAVRVNVCGTEE